MTDTELWALCESSGFTKSEWWPVYPGFGPLRYELGNWVFAESYGGSACDPFIAHAVILAGLVEWATTDHKWITSLLLGHETYGPDRWFATVESSSCRVDSRRPTKEAAMLECFRQWKESPNAHQA